jgi:zinc protease
MLATKQLLTLCTALLLSGIAAANPDIQHWQTGNGAQVFFVPAPELPMVDIQVTFNAGSARDGDRAGLAMLTNGMLEEGAGSLNADAIAEQFDRLGAKTSFDSLRDMATASLRSLTDEKLLQPAAKTFALLLREPSFPDAALERVRKQMLVGLRHESQSPESIGSRAFYQAIYGSHPYAPPPLRHHEERACAQPQRGKRLPPALLCGAQRGGRHRRCSRPHPGRTAGRTGSRHPA